MTSSQDIWGFTIHPKVSGVIRRRRNRDRCARLVRIRPGLSLVLDHILITDWVLNVLRRRNQVPEVWVVLDCDMRLGVGGWVGSCVV